MTLQSGHVSCPCVCALRLACAARLFHFVVPVRLVVTVSSLWCAVLLRCVYCAVCAAYAVRRCGVLLWCGECGVVQLCRRAVLSVVSCLLCGADAQRAQCVRCVAQRVWCCVVVCWWGGGPVWYPGSRVVPYPVVWWVRPVCGCPGCGAPPGGDMPGPVSGGGGGLWGWGVRCRPALVMVGWVGFCRK